MIMGIDEVGRGSLAGPLVVGAVSLNTTIDGVADSKQLTKNKRSQLAATIYMQASFVTLGWVWPHEIDAQGLTAATTSAIQRALQGLTPGKDTIIIDGNYNYLPGIANVQTIIGADKIIPSVSAASIVAKVARDSYMHSMAKYYPAYGFADNVGYGTKAHIEQLNINGSSAIHRLSFKRT